jgi:hypothetical protein
MRTQLLATAAALGLAATATAQTVFTDTFTSGTAADAGYYRFGTTNTTLTVDGGNLDYSYAVGATNRSGVIKQFANTTIEEGETLVFSFTIDSRALRGDENNSFRWSIGNIGTAVTGDFASTTPFSGGTRRNFVFAAATGTATTALNQHSAGFTSPVDGGTITALTGLAASNFAASSSDAFHISVSFTRTATGLDIVKNFGGSISSASFTTAVANDFIFNTIAFSFNNAGAYAISLDNISVSVVPEPSSFAALAGLGALGMVASRRRRRA